MKVDEGQAIVIACIIMVFLGFMLAVSYEVHEKSICRQTAIAHNMQYLEIKELCR